MIETSADIGDYFTHTEPQQDARLGQRLMLKTDTEAQIIAAKACAQAKGKISIAHPDEAHAVTISDRNGPDLPLVYVSAGFELVTGYTATDVLGQNCRFLQLPNQLTPGRPLAPLPAYNGYDQKRAILSQAIRDGGAAEVDIINYHKLGDAFLNRLILTPVDVERSRYYVGFLTDITPKLGNEVQTSADGALSDLKSAQSPDFTQECPSNPNRVIPFKQNDTDYWLRLMSDSVELVNLLSVFLGGSKQIICVVSPSLRILFMSKGMEALLNDLPRGLPDLSLLDVVHPEDKTTVQAQLHKLRRGSTCDIICRIVRGHCATACIEFRVSRTSSADRQRSYMVLCGRMYFPPLFPAQSLATESHNFDPLMWAKISRSGIILFATSILASLLHGHTDSEASLDDPGIIGLSFQSFMCQHSSTSFEEALASVVMQRAEKVTVRHCIGSSRACRMIMLSDLMLPDEHSGPQAGGHSNFVLIRMQHTAGNYISPSALVSKSSQLSVQGSSHEESAQRCIAIPNLLLNLNCAKSREMVTQSQGMSNHCSRMTIAKCPTAIAQDQMSPNNVTFENRSLANDRMFGFDPLPEMNSAPEADTGLSPQSKPDTCWQYDIHSLIQDNANLRKELEELQLQQRLLRSRRLRAKRRGLSECVNCHVTDTPEWRKGPSGKRDLCNRCGLKYAKDKHKQEQQQDQRTKLRPSIPVAPEATWRENVIEDEMSVDDISSSEDDELDGE